MSGKIIFLTFIGFIVMYGIVVHGQIDYITRQLQIQEHCLRQGNHARHTRAEMTPEWQLCFLKAYDVINDKGVWDKEKLRTFLEQTARNGPGPTPNIPKLVECADEATDGTLETRAAKYFKCLEKNISQNSMTQEPVHA